MLVVGVMLVSLILALSLNSIKRFKTLTKSIFFVPAMIGGVTIALIFDQIYYRLVPSVGQALGISWLMQSPLASTQTALPAVVFVNVWQAVAMPTLIFIAGLQSVPQDLYESAMLDGATVFNRFRYITFPYLMPTFTINMVLAIKSGITSFHDGDRHPDLQRRIQQYEVLPRERGGCDSLHHHCAAVDGAD